MPNSKPSRGRSIIKSDEFFDILQTYRCVSDNRGARAACDEMDRVQDLMIQHIDRALVPEQEAVQRLETIMLALEAIVTFQAKLPIREAIREAFAQLRVARGENNAD